MQFRPAAYVDDDGHLIFCPTCYPMLDSACHGQMHAGHLRRDYIGGMIAEIYDGEMQLEHVEEAIVLRGVPGAMLREFVMDGPKQHVFCDRGHAHGLLRRLRYCSTARVVFTNPGEFVSRLPIDADAVEIVETAP